MASTGGCRTRLCKELEGFSGEVLTHVSHAEIGQIAHDSKEFCRGVWRGCNQGNYLNKKSKPYEYMFLKSENTALADEVSK